MNPIQKCLKCKWHGLLDQMNLVPDFTFVLDGQLSVCPRCGHHIFEKLKRKAISLFNPWAWLAAKGIKKVETRSWHTHYRGVLFIHASKEFYPMEVEMRAFVSDEDFAQYRDTLSFTLGHIIGAVTLIDCIPAEEYRTRASTEDWQRESVVGDLSPGRYAWLFAPDAVLFPSPVQMRGYQKIWNVPDGILLPQKSPDFEKQLAI